MDSELLKNNNVQITGRVLGEPEFCNYADDEKFYIMTIEIRRKSNDSDKIPVRISEKLFDTEQSFAGKYVSVIGRMRSYKFRKGKSPRFNVFAHNFSVLEEEANQNDVYADGYVCSEPYYKETNLGRQITEMKISVQRFGQEKKDYVPCICWGRNAMWAGGFDIGTHVRASGRLQSRTFPKTDENGEPVSVTVYELSIKKLQVVKDEQT